MADDALSRRRSARWSFGLAAVAVVFIVACGTSPAPTGTSQSSSPTALESRDLEPMTEWRLLRDAVSRGVQGVQVATDSDGVRDMWTATGGTDLPQVDLEREVVIFLVPIVPADCPEIQLTGLHLDARERLLFGAYQSPPTDGNCSDRASGHLFVVAVAREALPQGRFKIRVMKDFQLCSSCGRASEETMTDVQGGSVP